MWDQNCIRSVYNEIRSIASPPEGAAWKSAVVRTDAWQCWIQYRQTPQAVLKQRKMKVLYNFLDPHVEMLCTPSNDTHHSEECSRKDCENQAVNERQTDQIDSKSANSKVDQAEN